MKVELRNVTEQNRLECMQLKINEEQKEYICSNEMSLKDAKENPDIARPFGIYIEDQLVGFVMFAFDEENEDVLPKREKVRGRF